MQKLLSFSLFCFLIVGLLSSCKKKDELDFLVDASCWKTTKAEVKNPTTNQWESSTIESCDADDCLTFSENGSLTYDEGATKCDPSDPSTSTGKWTLSDDKKTLTLTEGTDTIPFVVEELTSDKLVLYANLVFIEIRTTFEPK